jgi:hypothetical protein
VGEWEREKEIYRMSLLSAEYRQAIVAALESLPERELRSLLDYAEYLRERASEDAEDVDDSLQALQEEGNIPWEDVKREMRAGV